MLVSLTKVLRVAQMQGFAVGAFNTANLEMTQAIIWAAEELHAPVIVQTSEKAISYAGMKEISALVTTMAKSAKVPVVFHVDHGRTHQVLYDAIESGYSSIMFDGSHLEFEDNIKWTQEMVRRAHAKGISVEAELGRVGGVEDGIEGAAEGMTDPSLAVEFVKRTHCDALAVGIGNNHGKPKEGEYLHLDRLEAIRQVVSVPLVLHGASGTPEADIKKAIKLGITKINIDTDLRLAFAAAEREVLKQKDIYDPREILQPATDAVKEVVMHKISLFGSAMKAKEIV